MPRCIPGRWGISRFGRNRVVRTLSGGLICGGNSLPVRDGRPRMFVFPDSQEAPEIPCEPE